MITLSWSPQLRFQFKDLGWVLQIQVGFVYWVPHILGYWQKGISLRNRGFDRVEKPSYHQRVLRSPRSVVWIICCWLLHITEFPSTTDNQLHWLSPFQIVFTFQFINNNLQRVDRGVFHTVCCSLDSRSSCFWCSFRSSSGHRRPHHRCLHHRDMWNEKAGSDTMSF